MNKKLNIFLVSVVTTTSLLKADPTDSYGKTNNANEVDTYQSVIFTQEDRKRTIGNDPTNAIIPSKVTKIGKDCFAGCDNLTNISIPTSVSSIGADCFKGCDSLSSISIPSSVSVLDAKCFTDCSSLTSISIPTSVTFIGPGCFDRCSSLKSIDIPTCVSALGNGCFDRCNSLTSITIPKKLWNKKRLRLSDDIQVHFHEENEPVQMDIAHQENQIGLTDLFEDKSDTFPYDEDF